MNKLTAYAHSIIRKPLVETVPGTALIIVVYLETAFIVALALLHKN